MSIAKINSSTWPLLPAALDYVRRTLCLGKADALIEFQTGLREGLVKARGPIRSANAEPIEAEFFRFANLNDDGSVFDMASCRKIAWLEICASDVFQNWGTPADLPFESPQQTKIVKDDVEISRKRGPKANVRIRVVNEMRDRITRGDLSRDGLKKMQEVTLAHEFSASRDTVRKARIKLLQELATNSDN